MKQLIAAAASLTLLACSSDRADHKAESARHAPDASAPNEDPVEEPTEGADEDSGAPAKDSEAPRNDAPRSAFASVATGGAHTCALLSSGVTLCWGRGESGQLGVPPPSTVCVIGSTPFPCTTTAVTVTGGRTFTRLTGGGAHTCGLTADGTALCWGDNTHGQLGDGTKENRSAPTSVATSVKFVSIDAGASHTCALTAAGAAYCWGRNDRGQLGDGTTTARALPTAVTGARSYRQIVAGGSLYGQTCALSDAGTTFCWGDNETGQLGIGTMDLNAHVAPVAVSGSHPFAQIATGLGRHACALHATGEAYCWGQNSFGALGNGAMFTDEPAPVAVSGGLKFAQIVPGGFIGHTCALTASGKAYCWGDNEIGAIGDGTTTDRLVPAAVAGGLTFEALDAGLRHTCGVTSGGLYCWGSNGAGQLGDGSTEARRSPVLIGM